MIGSPVFSDLTEFSITPVGDRLGDRLTPDRFETAWPWPWRSPKSRGANRELASCQGGLHEQQPYPSTGEYGLAEMLDEHDIAVDIVHLRVEDPAPVG
jgi:hypothetical protein